MIKKLDSQENNKDIQDIQVELEGKNIYTR
jgi:hypothetical protein